MGVNHLFACLVVAEYDKAVQWYTNLFGRKPDLVPNEVEAAWRQTDSAWLYVLVDSERAGGGVVTLLIDDLDEMIGGLIMRGLSVSRIESYNNGARKAVVMDSDGNEIGLAQVKS